MTVDPRVFASLGRDVLLAYAGGLAIGAPVALLTVWLTGQERAATISLLAAMGVLLVGRRARRHGATGVSRSVAVPAVRRAA